jgi:lipopolysaccharide export LptBFGC system permease protein LptF
MEAMMPISALNASQSRSKLSIAFTSTVRVLFTTLLFTAGGMGAGLFLGILGTLAYGMIGGNKIDMTNAYRHVAIPVAILTGSIALIGSAVLEVRARRQRTSR